jgi:hypothetical protein
MRRFGASNVVTACLFWAAFAHAHSNLNDYVQQDIRLEARDTSIDLSIRLTFFDEHAQEQYDLIDTDDDGAIHVREVQEYGKKLVKTVEQQLQLSVDGRAVDLIPLYAPRFATRCRSAIGGDGPTVELHLDFFARIPDGVAPKGEVTLAGQLHADDPAILNFQATAEKTAPLNLVGTANYIKHPKEDAPLILRAQYTTKPEQPVQAEETTRDAGGDKS